MIKKMHVNKSNKLTKSARFEIIKHYHNGRYVVDIAKKFKVSRTTIYTIVKKYRNNGIYGLQDHKPGRLRLLLNPIFYANILDLRKLYAWGAIRVEKYFKRKGFSVSHNKINQVIQYEGLTRKKLGKQTKPKYVRYEADNINDQWHYRLEH